MTELTASMAGTVLNVLVSEGESVSKGQELVKLESMKMEIPIEGEGSGEVAEIKIQEGGFVNEGDVLLKLK